MIPGDQPNEVHWKQVWLQPSVHVSTHGVSVTSAMAYGVPRRSMTASPNVEYHPLQSVAMPSSRMVVVSPMGRYPDPAATVVYVRSVMSIRSCEKSDQTSFDQASLVSKCPAA